MFADDVYRCRLPLMLMLMLMSCAAGPLCAADAERLKFAYLGVNRMPAVQKAQGATPGEASEEDREEKKFRTFAYSSGPLAYDAATGELLVTGHNIGQLAVRIKPDKFAMNSGPSKDVTKFNQAALAGEWHDPSLGLREQLQKEYGGQQVRLGGMAFDDGVLWLGFWRFYNVTAASLPGLAAIKDGKPHGLWFVGEEHGIRTSKYLAVDPRGQVFTGASECTATGNWGPALYRVKKVDFSVAHNGKQAAMPLMEWSYKGEHFVWQAPNAAQIPKIMHYGDVPKNNIRPKPVDYVPTWRTVSCVVVHDPEDRPQVIYAVTRTIGTEWYGNGTVVHGSSALAANHGAANRGYHHEGQVTSLIVFPNLIASGGKDRSYYEEPLNHLLIRSIGVVTLTVDHKSRTLYLLEALGDWQTDGPILHAFSY